MPVIGKELRVPKSPQAPTPESERSDAELLSAVAEERCRAAFTEVVKRYERPAFNIALNITRSATLAEEAAQEAMLRVWLSAQRFDPEGSARGWILGIVARESLKKVRDRRKDAEKVKRAAQLDAPTLRAEEPAAEQKELLTMLQQGLEELPELNRQIIALYYGAGMSQAQIGQSVDLSQRMVGYKLEETLKLLRSRLAQAGLAAAAPALGSETLAQAVCSGYTPPAHLCSSVLARLDSAVAHAAEASARAVAAKGSSALFWAAAAVTMAAAAGGGWYALQEKEPGNAQNAPAVAAPESQPPSEAIAAPADEDKPFHRVWNFNDGPSSDFFSWASTWEWKRESDGVGRMIAKSGQPANVYVDVPLPKRPFVIHFRARAYGSGLVRNNFLWADQVRTMPHRMWSVVQTLSKDSVFDFYYLGRYVLYRTDGKTSILHEYETPYPGSRFVAVIANFRVEEIEMRDLTEKELAQLAFDPQAEIAHMESRNAIAETMNSVVFRGGQTDAPNRQEYKAAEALSWHWDFSDGIPKDFVHIGNDIAWKPAEGNRAAVAHFPPVKESEMKRGLVLPVRVTDKPCFLEMWGRAERPGSTSWGINLLDGDTYLRARYWPMANHDPHAGTNTWLMRCYLHGKKAVTLSNFTVLSVSEYANPTSGKAFAVSGTALGIQGISLRFVKPEDLPEVLRDEKAWDVQIKKAVTPSYEVGLPPCEEK
ncbi:MAG: sigma-70 family RNA polymerase sigma factor [Planctomycetes bacterium]|nr:sigma-70 family RNA polymerase sigma factor [Planctomycetota bacterium]